MEENIVRRMVQIGEVYAVDKTKLSARVSFPETGTTSDWLKCIQHYNADLQILDDQHTHTCPDGTTSAPVSPHNHYNPAEDNGEEGRSKVTYWMPKVGQMVLCVFEPFFNSPGFVIGQVM